MGNQHGSTTRATSAARAEALKVQTRDTEVLIEMYYASDVTAKEFGDALAELHPHMLYSILRVFTTRLWKKKIIPEKLEHVLAYAHLNGVYRGRSDRRLVPPEKLATLLRKQFSRSYPNTDIGKVFLDSAYHRDLQLMGRKLEWRKVQEEGSTRHFVQSKRNSRHPSERHAETRLKQEYFFRKIGTLPMFQADGERVCSVHNLEVDADSLHYSRRELYGVYDMSDRQLIRLYHRMYADGVRDERNLIAEREAESMHRLGCKYLVIYVHVPGHIFSMIATFDERNGPTLLDLNTGRTVVEQYFGVLALVKRIDVLLMRKPKGGRPGYSDRDIRRLRRGDELPLHDQIVKGRNLQEGENVGFCQSWDAYFVWYFFENGADVEKLKDHMDFLFTLTPKDRTDRIRIISNRMYGDAREWYERKRDAPRDAGYDMTDASPKRLRLE
jgi:hypothetical protein